ncbi:MAG: phospholipid carrier-dependent glycosyltransferase [Bryobacteraceae bacterium]
MSRPRSRSGGSAAAEPAARIAPRPDPLPRIESFLERHARWIALALVLIATARIIATYPVLSYTFDEPAHIAAGMEWLEKHGYTYEPQHPPLARVFTAILPRIAGFHGTGTSGIFNEGLAILGQGMDRVLTLARAGMLPFFWLTCWVVFSFTRWISGRRPAALLALALTTVTPSVLAHAGLATTDMALTACLLAAVYAGWRWIHQPSLAAAALAGLSLGAAILAKFSTLAFFPCIALIALAGMLYAKRFSFGVHFAQLGLAAAIVAAMIWSAYWFSFEPLWKGIEEVRNHDRQGHLTYLMGAANTVGWPSFYVIALAVKTPLPLLLLGVPGLLWMCRRGEIGSRTWILPATAGGILFFASFLTQIKIGTRHVLPVYVVLAIAAAILTSEILRRFPRRRAIELPLGALGAWMLLSSALAHPDYIGYFNFFAGSRPEAYLVDSDLDWSQDVKRLARRLKEVGAQEVYFHQYAPGDLARLFGFPPIRPLDLNGPHPGWNAVSVTPMKYGLFGDTRYVYDPGTEFWPDRMQPTERIGSGILLFYVPARR